jgi:hypothetical protein
MKRKNLALVVTTALSVGCLGWPDIASAQSNNVKKRVAACVVAVVNETYQTRRVVSPGGIKDYCACRANRDEQGLADDCQAMKAMTLEEWNQILRNR